MSDHKRHKKHRTIDQVDDEMHSSRGIDAMATGRDALVDEHWPVEVSSATSTSSAVRPPAYAPPASSSSSSSPVVNEQSPIIIVSGESKKRPSSDSGLPATTTQNKSFGDAEPCTCTVVVFRRWLVLVSSGRASGCRCARDKFARTGADRALDRRHRRHERALVQGRHRCLGVGRFAARLYRSACRQLFHLADDRRRAAMLQRVRLVLDLRRRLGRLLLTRHGRKQEKRNKIDADNTKHSV